MSQAILVVHPHRKFDHGFLEGRLQKFLEFESLPVFLLPRRNTSEVYAAGSYDKILEEDPGSLEKKGPGSLKDGDADEFVRTASTIILVGGYLSECLSNTYRSIVRAAERENEQVVVRFVKNLIYVQKGKTDEVTSMQKLMATGNEDFLEKYFARYPDSELVSHDFVSFTG